jgi:hypothetical protein
LYLRYKNQPSLLFLWKDTGLTILAEGEGVGEDVGVRGKV